MENNKIRDMNKYTVWVGGTEVCDHYVDRREAYRIATRYESQGYNDVVIEKVESIKK